MNALYRGSNGCYYTAEQVWHYYETDVWEYRERDSEPGREVVETETGRTVTIVPVPFDRVPFDLPGRELHN